MEQKFRLLHACKNAPAFDIYDNCSLLIPRLKLYEYSKRMPVPSGTHKITVYVAGTTQHPVISKMFRMLPGTSADITIDGSIQTIGMHKIKTPKEKHFLNRSLIRGVNLSADKTTVMLDCKRRLFQNIPIKKSTAYKSIFCGEHILTVNELPIEIITEANKAYTIYTLENTAIFLPEN